MLHKVNTWRHVVVGLVVATLAVLAGFRVIGAGDDGVFRPEHFDGKQVTVWPEGTDGVRIREVVDIDFGITERRGYQRIVPNDFGAPADVSASTPSANGDVNVLDLGYETRIRVGDPDITFTGRHRYVLEYVLPEARLSSGTLALDIIGTDETFRTDRFEVVLTGFELGDATCDAGSFGEFGGCTFEVDAEGNLVAVVEPLEPGEGITVGGTIAGLTTPVLPPEPALPAPIPGGFRPLGLAVAVAGLLTAWLVFAVSRWYGSNEVTSGGAADAAYGPLPAPGAPGAAAPSPTVPTYRVPDSRLAELATIEFVPPRGIEPWQGAVLLQERLGDDTVSAWFSEMVAKEAIVLRDDDGKLHVEPGPGTGGLSALDQEHLKRLFRYSKSIELGKYSKSFTSTWEKIAEEQEKFVKHSGWWKRDGPNGTGVTVGDLAWIIVVGVLVVGVVFGQFGRIARFVLGALASPAGALVGTVVVVAMVAYLLYRTLLPARTATGSALALLTESFRRFLAASEGQHVDWAWEHGLVREYSAWAVALGEADAWKKAVEASNIPDPDTALRGPLLVYTSSSSFHSTHTPPSSSGSGSGGGFSGGGGVGGGGGGGSSGSW